MFVPLGGLPDSGACRASAISADGSVVVGGCDGTATQPPEAFRWTQSGGMVALNRTPAFRNVSSSTATGVSGDGSVIVGDAVIGGVAPVAFRWTQATGMLQFLNGSGIVNAGGISSDGSVIYGSGYTWTQQGGIQLNNFAGAYAMSGARAARACGRGEDHPIRCRAHRPVPTHRSAARAVAASGAESGSGA